MTVVRCTQVQAWLYNLLAIWPSAYYFISLCLGFFICKMGMKGGLPLKSCCEEKKRYCILEHNTQPLAHRKHSVRVTQPISLGNRWGNGAQGGSEWVVTTWSFGSHCFLQWLRRLLFLGHPEFSRLPGPLMQTLWALGTAPGFRDGWFPWERTSLHQYLCLKIDLCFPTVQVAEAWED